MSRRTVNLLLAVAVTALLLRFAGPLTARWWEQRQAREVVEMVRAIHDAARQARAGGGEAALAGAPFGQRPDGLAPYLPEEVAFDSERVRLGWSWWSFGDVMDRMLVGDGLGTLTVEISSPGTRNAFLRLARESLWYRSGDQLTFLIPVPAE